MLRFYLICLVSLCPSLQATTYYVDSSVGSSGNGLAWATAWKAFSNITGLVAGDVVNISGGVSGQTYTLSSWTPTSGSVGNPITYQVAQDSSHNGTVTFTTSGSFFNGNFHDVVINGNVSGAQHWIIAPSNYIWEGGSGTNSNITLEYISVTTMAAGFHWPNDSASGLEIMHCNIVKTVDSSNVHDFIFYGGGGTGLDAIKVHDNYIEFPYSSADHSIGDDMWIYPNGTTFYNNTVQGTPISYTWTQHSDVFQTNLETNVHVYSNTIIDPGESVYYEDSLNPGTVSSVLIYNNLIVRSFACNGGAQRIFDMNPEGSGLNTTAYVDMVISNNTVVDQVSPCTFFTRVSGAGSYTRVYVTNDIQYPSNSSITTDAGVTVSNNYAGNTISFFSYVMYGGSSNDLHLTSGDTAVIGQGLNMSTYYTTDYAGTARTVPWDIGAYAYTTSSSPSSLISNGVSLSNGAQITQ